MKQDNIEILLKELHDSCDRMYEVFTQGSCVRLFKILKAVNPNAELYWSDRGNHAITKIDGCYYDIGGILSEDYVEQMEYNLILESRYKGYFLLRYSEIDNLKASVAVEKYFKG